MKKIYFFLVFSFAFNFLSFSQKQFDFEPFSTTNPDTALLAPLGSNTVTCGTLTLVITGTDLKCNKDNSGSATVTASGPFGNYTYVWDSNPSKSTASVSGLLAGNTSVEVWDSGGNDCIASINIIEPPSLQVNLNPSPLPPSCFGTCDGVATADPKGTGTSPYSYVWNNGQTNASSTGLCVGTHTVVVTDANGCVRSKSVTLIQPNPLIPNGSSTNINCAGNCDGTASVAPLGGTAPYTYSWVPGGATTSIISNLCVNNYICNIIDSHSCTTTFNASITAPATLSVSVTGSNLVCNGACTGSVTATVSGGSGTYTYNWMPGGYNTSSVTGLCANTYTLTVRDANGCSKIATITLTQPALLTSVPTGTNLNCFNQCDGTVNANAGGGTTPYTYAWSPGGCSTSACSGLCADTYSVTVSDANGCAIVKTILLTEPAILAITPSKTDESCAGSCNGTVTALMSGGTAPYTYTWSPGGCTTSTCSGLCAGTYSITVRDSRNCIATSSVTVSLPSAIVPNLSSVSVLCSGNCNGSVTSTTSGGTPPYSYSWSSGCTTSSCSGLCPGNYSVTITDAVGCTKTGTVSIGQPTLFTAAIASATPNPLNCNGDCNGAVLTSLNGGTPVYSYLWNNGATTASLTGLCVGSYSLTATDSHNCTANTSVTFTQPVVLSNVVTPTNPACNGGCNGSITASTSGGTGVYTYSWLPGGQTTAAISGQCIGNYTITVSDNKGCTNTQSVSLTAPSVVIANASVVSNVTCSGSCDGIATTAPTGGIGAYTYFWTGGATTKSVSNLCAGSVNVLVQDANGCSDLDVLNISQPSTLLSIISSTTSSCNSCSGAATITTVGGSTPYTYLWTPGGQTTSSATGLCVGNYTVSITDAHNCPNSINISIAAQISIVLSSSGPSVSCPGSCDGGATATPSGGGVPYTYSWNSAPIQTTQSATGLCAGNYTVTVTDITGCITTNTVSFAAPVALTSTMSSTSASCGLCNGTATVAGSGGTGTLTYSWSGFPVQTTPTATGLCQGDYTVTLTDANNCSTTNTVTVGNVPAISANASTTLSNCGGSDGAICVAPSGGTPGYTYLWSPGGKTISCITGLAAGIYTVTISDVTGCSNKFSIGLGNVAGPTVTVTSVVNPTCNADCNGSISVSTAGASPPFTYSWNPSGQTTTAISSLCAGTYIVQVKDNVPCTTFSSTTLTDPPQMNSNPVITDVSCKNGNNGNICLSPSGGSSPYTYKWLPGGQTTSCRAALTAGTYSVVLADAIGCDDTIAIPVTEPAMLTVSISATNVTCNGNANGTAAATVTGGTTLYTYAWSTGSPLPSIVGLSPGNYSITVTDNNGCTATASVTISQPTSITTTVSPTNITCKFLCNGRVAITASGGTGIYTYSWLPGGETTSIISGLCPGGYAATVTDANGCSSTKTVTITEPAAVSATVASTNSTCFAGCNGTASASVSGGTGSYTYLWNSGSLTTSAVTGLCVNGYTLTTTDANGCSSTNLFSITAPTIIQANITNTPTSCTSTCDGTASSSPVGGTGPYTYLWSNGQTTTAATGLCANTYTLTLSDANGCSIIKTTNITSPTALSQISSVGNSTCLQCNGTISVIGSGGTSPYSFFWSTGKTAATITGLCAGVYSDTIKDAKGCININTNVVNNISGPAITIARTNINCFGACNGTATISSVTGNGPPWIYSWSPTTPTQSTQTATGLCPNQYFGSVTDINGCITTGSVTITQATQLASNAVPTNATCFGICDGGITTGATGGTGTYTYNWLPGGQTTTSISAQCAGNYTLTLKDANNCSLTTTVTIGQNTILSPAVTSTNNSCNASCNGTASIAISGGTSPYTYSWTGGKTTNAVTGLCAGSYTVTVNDVIGCLSISTVTVTQPTTLTTSMSAVNPLCNSSCNGSVSSSVSGGTSPYTYLWMPGSLTTTAISGLCAGTYSLSLTDANACPLTNTATLTDPGVLSSAYVITAASCVNTCDGNINATPSGGTTPYTFSWSPGGQTTQNISRLCSGNYSLAITDANACAASYTMSVGITTLVIAATGNDTSFCLGGIASLTSASTNASSVNWYQLPAWLLVGSANTVTVSPAAGNTDYALIALNGICSDTDTVRVTVFNYPIVIANNTTICSGTSATVCASGANSYQWFQLPAWTPIATGTCFTVAPAVGITNYGIIGMNGICSDTDTVALRVLAMPAANAGTDTAFCSGGNVTLCSKLSQNGATFNWFNLPSWTPRDTDTCTTVTPLITSEYALIVSNGLCSDTDSVSVVIFPSPIADAGSNVTILASTSTILNGSGNGTYLWTPAIGLSSTTDPNPTATPTATTAYVLLVTDASGCTSSDTVIVTIIGNVRPNDGISPNGDGINDIWIIPGIEGFPNALVEVYNRWGEILFSTVDYKNNKWGGTFKGKELPVGTYYYVINLNSDLFKDPITGPITILR